MTSVYASLRLSSLAHRSLPKYSARDKHDSSCIQKKINSRPRLVQRIATLRSTRTTCFKLDSSNTIHASCERLTHVSRVIVKHLSCFQFGTLATKFANEGSISSTYNYVNEAYVLIPRQCQISTHLHLLSKEITTFGP